MLRRGNSPTQKLVRLLRHAQATTPFFRNALSVTTDLDDPKILELLPIVQKRVLRATPLDYVSRLVAPTAQAQAAVEKLLSDEASWENESRAILPEGTTVVLEKTSGSTGTPLKLIKTETERLVAGKSVWNLRRKLDPTVRPKNLFPFEHAPLEFDFPYDLGDYSAPNVAAILEEIARGDYTWIHGHPQGLEWWAEIILEKPSIAQNLCLHYIESNGSPLSTQARSLIEAAFRCPVIDNYNSREVWTIAFQCKLGHLHVNDECVKVEIVDDRGSPVNRPGTAGQLIVTALHSYAMPLIRYALGDRVQYEECDGACCPSSPAIQFATSPAQELIAGTTVSGADVFSKVSRYLYGAFGFQYKEIRVVQSDLDHFDVWVGDLRGDAEVFREQFQQVTGLLLAPKQVRVRLNNVSSEASIFHEHPRSVFISVDRWNAGSVYA